MTTVLPVEEGQIQDKSGFTVKNIPDFQYPVYLDKNLESIWDRAKIDVTGWATFKQLLVVPN